MFGKNSSMRLIKMQYVQQIVNGEEKKIPAGPKIFKNDKNVLFCFSELCYADFSYGELEECVLSAAFGMYPFCS